MEMGITREEREYLRELAKKYLEYANLPVMADKTALWYRHNACRGERPIVVIEQASFLQDMLPPLRCESEGAQWIEKKLQDAITCHELIDDDKVISPYFPVSWQIRFREFDTEIKVEHAVDREGRNIGFRREHPIHDLKRDLPGLRHSTYNVDREETLRLKQFAEEILGDLMPVVIENTSLTWYTALSSKVVTLMGLETMMISIMDYPDEMHALFRFLMDDIKGYLSWQEREGLLTLNNGNHYAGAGSFGFTGELPTEECKKTGRITTKDLWGNMNSQETVGISPAMYEEFIQPYYLELSQEFGLTYYGCCEPVHGIWKDCVSKLHNLRKVSVSPWCDEEFMGEALRGSGVIYSRKPSPNFIGVGEVFDEAGFTEHIAKTLRAAKGCNLEFIFRDTYTVTGDRTKPGRAVKIVRNLIDKMW